jgi:2-polyprenyl-3-methyl-5-hydroxy-6-metoxy-1,4-benzoquinol methylase
VTKPHTSWASVYDIVYEESFGDFYHSLTDATIEIISNVVNPPARIVDFGAGTGRLSIPLVSMGYEVLAVEPCKEMLEQLTCKPNTSPVKLFNGSMQNFKTETPFDMAICVFTVLLYFLDKESLIKSIQAAFNSLVPGGLLLIDVPSKMIFQDYNKSTQNMDRFVSISKIDKEDIYEYAEYININYNGKAEIYTDTFNIKYWDTEKVMKLLLENGFLLEKDLSYEFAGAGSNYFLMKKVSDVD